MNAKPRQVRVAAKVNVMSGERAVRVQVTAGPDYNVNAPAVEAVARRITCGSPQLPQVQEAGPHTMGRSELGGRQPARFGPTEALLGIVQIEEVQITQPQADLGHQLDELQGIGSANLAVFKGHLQLSHFRHARTHTVTEFAFLVQTTARITGLRADDHESINCGGDPRGIMVPTCGAEARGVYSVVVWRVGLMLGRRGRRFTPSSCALWAQ